MNNITILPKSQELAAQSHISALTPKAKDWFKTLAIFKGNWEDSKWKYNNQYVRFVSGSTSWNEGVSLIAKIYLVKCCYDHRGKGLYSFTNIRGLIRPFATLDMIGVESVHDITQETYEKVVNDAKQNTPGNLVNFINSFNQIIGWLINENLLTVIIDTTKASRSSNLALPKRMPQQDLIRSIIQTKWAIESSQDNTPRLESDLLAIYTQAFQFAIGLRIGEVLRLPADPLITHNGELYLKVWTEKGSMPMARYVPDNWRELLTDVVQRIINLSAPSRQIAKELETTGRLVEVGHRLSNYHSSKQREVQNRLNDFDRFLESLRIKGDEKWKTTDVINPNRNYDVWELNDLFPQPIRFTSPNKSEVRKRIQEWGVEMVATKLGKTKCDYYITGQSILNFINEKKAERLNYVTDGELLEVIHGRKLFREQSGDQAFKDVWVKMQGGKSSCYNFTPLEDYDGGRRPVSAIHVDNARKIIEAYAGGGFDSSKYIDLYSFQQLFPDLFESNLSISLLDGIDLKGLKVLDKARYYVKTLDTSENVRYRPSTMYLLEQDSIHDSIKQRYEEVNYSLEQELANQIKHEEQSELDSGIESIPATKSIVIQSKSFKVEQKVSEYLFLRAYKGTSRGLVPEIFGYHGVTHAIKGNDRADGMFVRYGISTDNTLSDQWQSHMGRHWQTTSLFRAGASSEVVNRWMGRTATQGDHYDHNSGHERAIKIKDAMLKDTNRFAGAIANQVRKWIENKIPLDGIDEYLDQELATVHHTPTGLCTRPMYLKPCDMNMKCLTGNNGNGCKHFALDLYDEAQVAKLTVERDKAERMLERLGHAVDQGIAGAELHLQHHMTLWTQASKVLEVRQFLVDSRDGQRKDSDFLPFEQKGDYPEDCPFQCGDN